MRRSVPGEEGFCPESSPRVPMMSVVSVLLSAWPSPSLSAPRGAASRVRMRCHFAGFAFPLGYSLANEMTSGQGVSRSLDLRHTSLPCIRFQREAAGSVAWTPGPGAVPDAQPAVSLSPLRSRELPVLWSATGGLRCP